MHRRLGAVADSYDPPRMLVGETFVEHVEDLIPFYGNGDELNLAFNIPFVQRRSRRPRCGTMIERTEELMPAGCTPVLDRQQPRRPPLPDPLGGERSRRGAVRADDAA